MEAIPPGAISATINQTMAALSIGRTKLYQLVNDGQLVRREVDAGVRIEVASIKALRAEKGALIDIGKSAIHLKHASAWETPARSLILGAMWQLGRPFGRRIRIGSGADQAEF